MKISVTKTNKGEYLVTWKELYTAKDVERMRKHGSIQEHLMALMIMRERKKKKVR